MFGFIHEITWVDLGTMAIEIERTEQNALLTKDPQYADIKAIFYIKVNPTVEGIIDAARTIGGKAVDANAVKTLVEAKLDGALRDVAATFTLMSLHQEREKVHQGSAEPRQDRPGRKRPGAGSVSHPHAQGRAPGLLRHR